MVQLYNPSLVGKQVLIDVKHISSDRLKTIEDIKPLMDKVVEVLKLNVVGECSHQFKKDNNPHGVTMVYLLSESHLSIHTFVDEGKIRIDLFTCDVSLEDRVMKEIVCDYFNISFLNIDMSHLTRG